MAKLCGFISTLADQPTIEATVQTMAQALCHGQREQIAYQWFRHGGMAIVGGPTDRMDEVCVVEYGACLGLAGHTLGAGRGAAGLLRELQRTGYSGLAQLNGDWVFAQHDAANETLTLASSKYGFCPCYYAAEHGELWFASEAKAIARVQPTELDWTGAADFFYVGHMLGQRTLFKGVSALQPGAVLRFSDGRLHTRRHSDFATTPVMPAGQVSTKQIAELFLQSVERRLERDQPQTVLLSGGFDSRLILGALRRLDVRPRVVTLEHADEHSGADGRYAMQIAQQLGVACELRHTRRDFYDSPDCRDVFALLDGMAPTWDVFISQVYAELDPSMGAVWEGMVLGSGLGGEHQRPGGIAANLPKLLDKRAQHRRLLRHILVPDAFALLDGSFADHLRAEIAQMPASENQYPNFLLQHRIRRRIAPNPHSLFASKVSPRTPGTDRDFMDYLLAVPSHMRLNHQLYLALVRDYFPELLKVPIVSGGVPLAVQRDVTTRARAWGRSVQATFKRELRPFNPKRRVQHALGVPPTVEEAGRMRAVVDVLAQRAFDRPFYNRAGLQPLFAAYRAGDMRYHELFTLALYIELWHQLFIDGSSTLAQAVPESAYATAAAQG